MKKLHRFLPILLLLVQYFISDSSFAQAPGKWTDWSTASCYQGISVSVVNMGHSNSAGGYLWGMRLRNDYSQPITFRYRLSIGEKNTSQEGGDAVWKLKPGEIWTDGNDKFTAKLYQSSSIEYNYYIWSVCFGEAKCGSTCYAKCDATKGVANQPCGVDSPPTAKKPNPPVTGNTNKPTTSGGTPASTSTLNKVEIDKEAKKLVDLMCKKGALEIKWIQLDAEEKPIDAVEKQLKAACIELSKYLDYTSTKYAEIKNKQASELFQKVYTIEYAKCKTMSNEGMCAEFE